MKVWVLVVLMLYEIHVYCYNIDIKFPIIYSGVKTNVRDRSSYFGFSLILHKDWIQIGAPRANSTVLGNRVMEPGVAYRCGTCKKCQTCKGCGVCEEVALDMNVNDFREGTTIIKDLKNHSWIGGAMAMGDPVYGKVVVCGHRWKNQADLTPAEETPGSYKSKYAMSGICYISRFYKEEDFSHQFDFYLPPETFNIEKCLRYGPKFRNRGNCETYGLFHNSQIGISLHIATVKKKISLLIGAPGAGVYWSGGTLEYIREPQENINARRKRQTEKKSYSKYQQKKFVYNEVLPDITTFSYFGYQVVSGLFFSKEVLCHVASSPRGAEMKGSVVLYNVQYDNEGFPKIMNSHSLVGESFGEYFGGSLAVADVTGDTLHELIVGAPLCSNDKGCIYIYTRYTNFSLYRLVKRTGFKLGGRFGTAVASLGDIDQDKYEDIAVGAPYEGSGVVYIFNGNPRGISDKYSQSIKASDIFESIRGFGISISRPVDIDDNTFADVAIGSYISEHVVLLRTYPVIELIANMTTNIKQFNLNDTTLTIHACLMYNGPDNFPDGVDVVRHINIDIEFHRFKPISSRPVKLLKKLTPQCEDITIEMKERPTHIAGIEDIKIVLSQKLNHNKNISSAIVWMNSSTIPSDVDKFCRFCPIVRKNHTDILTVPYAQSCGSDDVCESDVRLHCRLEQNGTLLNTINGYVIGSSKSLKLIVNISNHGETLYSPKVKIYLPKEVNLAQIPQTCQYESSSLTCNFAPIINGMMKSVNINLDLSKSEKLISLWEEHLPVLFEIGTISAGNHREINEENNKCNIKLALIMKANIYIKGKSQEDLYTQMSDSEERKGGKIEVVHIYEVSNIEVSPVKHVQTHLYVPVLWHEHDSQISFSEPSIQVHQDDSKGNKRSVSCSRTGDELRDNTVRVKGSLPGLKTEIASSSVSDSHPANRTLYLNCSSSNVICETFMCNFYEIKTETTAKIIITSKINMSTLAPVMGHRDIIFFSTHGHVDIIGHLHKQNVYVDGSEIKHDETVSSTIMGTVPSEKLQLWIIILCIIVGILLIVAIITGLYKAGFFKRAKKEELMALKHSENGSQ